MKKKALRYQAGLRIMLDWFGFVPYTAESKEDIPSSSKEASVNTALKRTGPTDVQVNEMVTSGSLTGGS